MDNIGQIETTSTSEIINQNRTMQDKVSTVARAAWGFSVEPQRVLEDWERQDYINVRQIPVKDPLPIRNKSGK